MASIPARRPNFDLVSAGDEITLFDVSAGRFHTLNATAASIWNACDGSRSDEQIAKLAGVPAPVVALALHQFDEAGLLVETNAWNGSNRRRVLKQIAAAAAGAIALPVVASITGADAVAANGSCIDVGVCCPIGFNDINCPCCQGINFGITLADGTCPSGVRCVSGSL